MKENYKKLGNYIQQVDIRNKDLRVTRLLGLSIEKHFIESIANTIGTDFRPYKIVKQGQFAYGPVTSRNGDKITIALLEEPECIISSSYSVFEVTKPEELLPEFLMLWFSRPEFDRYARFKSHGSVREMFDWEEMCNVELPMPDIKEQCKIVDAYNKIQKRINLKYRINKNIEDILQMKFLDTRKDSLTSFLITDISQKVICGKTPPTINKDYWGKDIPFITIPDMHGKNFIINTSRYLSKEGQKFQKNQTLPKGTICVSCIATVGLVTITTDVSQTNQQINSLICNKNFPVTYIYMCLKNMTKHLEKLGAGGSTTLNISKALFSSIKIRLPSFDIMSNYENKMSVYFYKLYQNEKELLLLEKIKENVVTKISKL